MKTSREATLFRMLMTFACALLCAAAAVASRAALADDGRRLALVIGNADYSFAPLRNPVNDARAMADALQELGFDVIRRENTDLSGMLDAIREFALKASKHEVRLFYYAGHGVQVEGKNYLIPLGSEIGGDDEIALKSADMSQLVDRLGRLEHGLNIVILDACRNNPFKDAAFKTADGRLIQFRGAVPSGLARMEAPQGTLLAYATAPGAVAMDGQNYNNSLYTKHLLAHITTPGLPVEQLFKRVRIAVAQETRRLQIPWESSSLMGDFCFRHGETQTCGLATPSLGRVGLPVR